MHARHHMTRMVESKWALVHPRAHVLQGGHALALAQEGGKRSPREHA